MISAGVPAPTMHAAGIAALGTQVDDPIGGADHVEVVLDDEERVPGLDQPPEGAQQFGDIVEMQAGRRLVEQEQRAAARAALARGACAFPGLLRAGGAVRQMTGELEALRFAAGQRRHGLAQAQVIEPHFGERRQPQADFRVRAEKSPALRRP